MMKRETPGDEPIRDSLRRFLVSGLQDAERRLGFATAHAPVDDARVLQVVSASRLVRTLGDALDLGRAAWESSSVVRAANAFRMQWDRLAPSSRRVALGTTLLVASATHLALTAWQGAPAGWLWLVPPTLAIVIGALTVALSNARESSGTP